MKTVKMVLLISLFALSASANAALHSRLGGLAYYDDEANLTWLADSNASGIIMTWDDASTWVAGLVVGGVDNWRLPDAIDSGLGCNTSYNGTDCGYNVDTDTGELANMYYNVLGNLAYYDTAGNGPQAGFGLTNTGPFNINPVHFWSSREFLGAKAGIFHMGNGNTGFTNKGIQYYTWAVQSGDVSAVPVPAAAWLFGSALMGLVGLGKRKR